MDINHTTWTRYPELLSDMNPYLAECFFERI
jgi:hypothetical protein